MNQISKFQIEKNYKLANSEIEFSTEELLKLKQLLSLTKISNDGKRMEIGNDEAKLVISQNGQLRLKGRNIIQVARGEFRVNAAVIELN